MGILDAPGISPRQAARVANRGGGLVLLTDAARQAYTPPLDEIIYTTDTHGLFRGDGATAGGVSAATGWTDQQLIAKGWVAPRCTGFLAGFYEVPVSGPFTGVFYGNSIVQGSGQSGGFDWPRQLAARLQAANGLGTVNQWSGPNRGVGGSQVYLPMAYASDLINAAGAAVVAPDIVTGAPLAFLMTMRNEAAFAPSNYAQYLEVTIRALKRRYKDVVVVSDPPTINTTTGVINDGANWAALLVAAKSVSAKLNATYVDVWSWFRWMYEQGVDLRPLIGDGTHPTADGYGLISGLVLQSLLMPPQPPTPLPARRAGVGLAAKTISINSYAASTAPASPVAITGLSSSSTARWDATAEGSALSYNIANGQSISWKCPLPVWAMSFQLIQGGLGSGTATFNGASLGTIANSAGSALETNRYVTTSGPVPGEVILSCNSANPMVTLGMTWFTPEPADQHDIWPNKTESGTWSAGTFAGTGLASGAAARFSATVGDYTDIVWYGTQLAYGVQVGADQGKVTLSTDGGATTTVDLYQAATDNAFKSTAELTEGWHTTRFTVATKNASASANTVKVGFWRSCINPSAKVTYVSVAVGETMPLIGRWRLAVIDRILSGSPNLAWSPEATTLAVTGSGSAVIRLER